jgi:hypothetical protein
MFWSSSNGKVNTRPKRTSKMGHMEFKAYVDAALALICDEYISEMSPGRPLSDVEAMLNIKYSDAFPEHLIESINKFRRKRVLQQVTVETPSRALLTQQSRSFANIPTPGCGLCRFSRSPRT